MTNYKFAKARSVTPAAGKYAKRSFTFSRKPAADETLQISWNSVTRTYTFVESPSGASTQTINHPPTYLCQIGATAEETVANLVNTIHSNVHDTTLGEDTTISTSIESPAAITVHSNAKISGTITITPSVGTLGSQGSSTAGTDSVEEPGAPYSALVSNGTITKVLVRDPAASVDGYNAGPPVNQLSEVVVNLPANVVIPLQTWGATGGTITFLK